MPVIGTRRGRRLSLKPYDIITNNANNGVAEVITGFRVTDALRKVSRVKHILSLRLWIPNKKQKTSSPKKFYQEAHRGLVFCRQKYESIVALLPKPVNAKQTGFSYWVFQTVEQPTHPEPNVHCNDVQNKKTETCDDPACVVILVYFQCSRY